MSRDQRTLNMPPPPRSYQEASAAGSAGTSSGSGGRQDDFSESESESESLWVCNVCLDPAQDPVVTQCGHLYCWPCLFRWLSTRRSTCPVCKAACSRENVIPIFLGGSDTDPRGGGKRGKDAGGSAGAAGDDGSTPARPTGQRPDPEETAAAGNAAVGAQVSLAGNLGFFPSLFGLQFQQFLPAQPAPGATGPTAAEAHEKFLANALVCLGSTVFVCFLFF